MLPLLTFASGLIVGIAGVRLVKSAKSGDGLRAAADTVGAKAREAAVSGLATVEKTSASLRDKLKPAKAPETETPETEKPAADAAETDELPGAPS